MHLVHRFDNFWPRDERPRSIKFESSFLVGTFLDRESFMIPHDSWLFNLLLVQTRPAFVYKIKSFSLNTYINLIFFKEYCMYIVHKIQIRACNFIEISSLEKSRFKTTNWKVITRKRCTFLHCKKTVNWIQNTNYLGNKWKQKTVFLHLYDFWKNSFGI